ncbi:hypothetical protein QTP88_017330 [Uroleucon formosanum]
MQRNNSDTKLKNKPKLSPLTIKKTISHKTQDVTSPSVTPDNDQEWNATDNNKRIRSPNNTTSPRTKKTNEPSNFSSPNRYSLHNIDEDNMDLDTNTKINDCLHITMYLQKGLIKFREEHIENHGSLDNVDHNINEPSSVEAVVTSEEHDINYSEVLEIPGSDPAEWKINSCTIDYICQNGFSQNLDSSFSQSKRIYNRGLPFRGDNKNIGSLHNGNFLMCLEMIAEFDPFLANHLSNYGNPGKGYTSYLSHSTYEQFIKLMATKVQNQIVEEVINAQYFSIVIDSTPDIAHVDQLSFILRYVNNKGLPVERFLCFLENVGHKSQCMADTVFSILKKYNIDIAYLRGQSYDNAKNMSGIYSGLQARIKEVSPLADFVPCSAHSLNLVGSCAASCCKEANIFFNFIQIIYTFFSSSTHRWNLLKVKSTLKNLSKTRWSAREDACKALNQNWDSVKQSLCDISEYINEKSITQNEACGLLKLMNRFEVTFMSLFWGDLLQRFNVVSKYL